MDYVKAFCRKERWYRQHEMTNTGRLIHILLQAVYQGGFRSVIRDPFQAVIADMQHGGR